MLQARIGLGLSPKQKESDAISNPTDPHREHRSTSVVQGRFTAEQLGERVQFQTMDLLCMFEFPDESFCYWRKDRGLKSGALFARVRRPLHSAFRRSASFFAAIRRFCC